MERIENTQIKRFLTEYVSTKLENCRPFVQVFGKGFAKKRLELNLGKVYTNVFDSIMVGTYNLFGDHSITLYTSNHNEQPLTIEELSKDSVKMSTMFHEAIHAIFRRTDKECKKYRIQNGTGILETTKGGKEFGRGLNEGLTNWICEKAGLDVISYIKITDLVRELELAIGTKNVMKLGKGNISKNIAKILNMSELQCYAFLSKIDPIYILQDKYYNEENFVYLLRKYKNRDNLSEIEKRNFEDEFRDMEEHYLYQEMLQDENYLFLKAQSDNELDAKISYFKERVKIHKKREEKAIAYVESIIFDKYFKTEFEKYQKSNKFSQNKFVKFQKLARLITVRENIRSSEETSSERFKRNFTRIYEKSDKSDSTGNFRISYACNYLPVQDLYQSDNRTQRNKVKEDIGIREEL